MPVPMLGDAPQGAWDSVPGFCPQLVRKGPAMARHAAAACAQGYLLRGSTAPAKPSFNFPPQGCYHPHLSAFPNGVKCINLPHLSTQLEGEIFAGD